LNNLASYHSSQQHCIKKSGFPDLPDSTGSTISSSSPEGIHTENQFTLSNNFIR